LEEVVSSVITAKRANVLQKVVQAFHCQWDGDEDFDDYESGSIDER
jgi:hypothetical protein